MAARLQTAAGVDRQFALQGWDPFLDEARPLTFRAEPKVFVGHQFGDGEAVVNLGDIDLLERVLDRSEEHTSELQSQR